MGPMSESVDSLINMDELVLPPPWGTTGFVPRVGLEKESVPVLQDRRYIQNKRSLLQARLQEIYIQDDTTFIEKDLIGLAVQWNILDSTAEVAISRLQKKDTVHTIRKSVSGEGGGSPWQSISDTFQTKLQGLYSQNTTANKDMDLVKVAKEWDNSDSTEKGSDLVTPNETIHVVGNDENVRTTGMPKSESGAEFQARLQGLYGQHEGSNREHNLRTLPKE